MRQRPEPAEKWKKNSNEISKTGEREANKGAQRLLPNDRFHHIAQEESGPEQKNAQMFISILE